MSPTDAEAREIIATYMASGRREVLLSVAKQVDATFREAHLTDGEALILLCWMVAASISTIQHNHVECKDHSVTPRQDANVLIDSACDFNAENDRGEAN